jgi:exodeoxyribonuclease-5
LSTDWSPDQERALDQVGRWLKAGPRSRQDQVFRLFGFAGTGKTTLARHVAEGVDGDVVFAAYTGKAALVNSPDGLFWQSQFGN